MPFLQHSMTESIRRGSFQIFLHLSFFLYFLFPFCLFCFLVHQSSFWSLWTMMSWFSDICALDGMCLLDKKKGFCTFSKSTCTDKTNPLIYPCWLWFSFLDQYNYSHWNWWSAGLFWPWLASGPPYPAKSSFIIELTLIERDKYSNGWLMIKKKVFLRFILYSRFQKGKHCRLRFQILVHWKYVNFV